MAMDKAKAEAAAKQWKVDAAKLAEIESEKAQKSKKTLDAAKEKAAKKVAKAENVLDKQKGVFSKIEGEEESIDVKAQRNAKLAQMVTETFSKRPVLEHEKKEAAEKAAQKAKDAKDKEKELEAQAKKQKAEADAAKADAAKATSTDLQKALDRKENAKEELDKATEAVESAKRTKSKADTAGVDTRLGSSNSNKPISKKAAAQAQLALSKTKSAAKAAKAKLDSLNTPSMRR